MKSRNLAGAFHPQNSLLSQMDMRLKLSMFLFTMVTMIVVRHVAILVIFALIVVLLRWRFLHSAGILVLGAVALGLTLSGERLDSASMLAIAILRVVLISELLRALGESLTPDDLYQLPHIFGEGRLARETFYLLSSVLTALPLLRRDLGRTMDAEQLRLGHSPRPWMISVWANILVNLVVRAIERAHETAQSALERGFTLTTEWDYGARQRMTGREIRVAATCFLGLIAIVVVDYGLLR